jgi:hypothetical protein
MVKGLSIVFVLALVSVAHADPTSDADPDTAQRLSIVGTAVPIAAIGVGALVAAEGSKAPIRDIGGATALSGALLGVITPSLGEMYSHRAVTGGMGLRAGGLLVEYVGLMKLANNDIGDCADVGPCHHPASTYLLLATGAGLYFGGMALDIVHAPDAAREWNRRYEVQLVPTTLRSGATTTTGLAIAGRF